MPSLEIWVWWVKDLLWPANSPHSSSTILSYKDKHLAMLHATLALVKMVARRKILAWCVIVAMVVKKKREQKKRRVKESLGEGVVEKSRANWCIPPTYEGVET